MKPLFTICLITGLFTTACQQEHKNTSFTPTNIDSAGALDETANDTRTKRREGMDISTYHDTAAIHVELQQHNLERIAAAHVFSAVNTHVYHTLPEAHQDYFIETDYDVLHMAQGNLFGQGKTDAAFTVYDNKHNRIGIVIYNAATKKYGELYYDIDVYNALAKAECNFNIYPTPDCQLGGEIALYDRSLIHNPAYLENYESCKIADIQQDSTFVLKAGCFAPGIDKKAATSALCISTSWTYNNWQCLQYDKAQDAFVVFYGQAFAD